MPKKNNTYSILQEISPILFLSILSFLLSIANTLVKLFFLNTLFEGKQEDIPFFLFGIATLYLLENLIQITIEGHKIRLTKRQSTLTFKKIIEHIARLPLAVQESAEIQDILHKADTFFSKSLTFSVALAHFVNLGIGIFVLIFLIHNTSHLIIPLIFLLFGLVFYFNFRSTKSTFGVWQRYMEKTRRFNYFSDVQTKREYAYERRVYHSFSAMEARFLDAFARAKKENQSSGLQRLKGQALTETLNIGISVSTFFYFSVLNILQNISIGAYVASIELIAKLLETVSLCTENTFTIKEFVGLYRTLQAFLAENPSPSSPIHKEKEEKTPFLACENVSFAYPRGDKNTISQFSYTFQNGVHYGLVGVNGAGKTTLVKLLLGLYQPHSGTICNCFKHSTALFQDFQLYPMSVREYLLMGNNPQITDAQLENILTKLNVGTLTFGLDTMMSLVYEEGTLVSKGQLQKLALARAFLSDASLIILDEPTASLDPIAE